MVDPPKSVPAEILDEQISLARLNRVHTSIMAFASILHNFELLPTGCDPET